MTIVVDLKGVTKKFANGLAAFGPLDLELHDGEFVSLVGPSGCGKSTTLRVIAGLLAPSEGGVAFPQGRPEIAFVFQEPTLMPWARVLENARLPLDLKRVPRAEANARARRALHRVGLEGFERAFPRELSGGMKMRVSIARAIAAAHSVFESTYLSSRVVVLTPRPGRVAADIRLSPPATRDAGYRLSREFADAAGQVSQALRDAMEHAA